MEYLAEEAAVEAVIQEADRRRVYRSLLADVGEPVQPINSELRQILQAGLQLGCTDVHLKVNEVPLYRVHGLLVRDPSFPRLTSKQLKEMSLSLLSESNKRELEYKGDCDLGIELPKQARFRVNVYLDRNNFAIAFRFIPRTIPHISALGLPEKQCKDFAMKPRGLVLVTGPTGSGKTTTQAAMIDFINECRALNIVTIEDPIEYYHVNKKAAISQREVNHDTLTFHHALRSALRQDPDVILIGEMRDLESIRIALTAAETGHLVLCTLHTNSAHATITRIIDVFPAHQQAQIRLQLSMTLVGILSQALLPATADSGLGRVLATEVLVANHAIRNMIRESRSHQLHATLQVSSREGMKTFDMDLRRLLSENKIDLKTAISVAHYPDEFLTEMEAKA